MLFGSFRLIGLQMRAYRAGRDGVHRTSIVVTLMACAMCLMSVAARAQDRMRNELRLTGVNIAGAEFAGRKLPGTPGRDYFYPARSTIDYFAAKGMNIIRVPFRWERLQPQLNGPLDGAEWQRLDEVVRYATGKGVYVLLDVHNYAAYRQNVIGTADVSVQALRNLWGKIAARYRENHKVGFGLMNEPKGLPTETWLAAANAAIADIRRTGAKNLIFVPGNGWTGAHSWFSRGYGTPNADVMRHIVDPAQNYVYEVHQYLDSNYSGTHPQCKDRAVGVKSLTAFTQWLRRHAKLGFLGEFGGGTDETCLAALNAMLKFMHQNRDVWLGWTYWAAGPWPPSYFTSVQPVSGADRPQMDVLLKHLAPARDHSSKRENSR